MSRPFLLLSFLGIHPDRSIGRHPRKVALSVYCFHFLLVLTCVHGFPEAFVQIGVQESQRGNMRQNLRLEIAAMPELKALFFECKKTGVDPVISNDGFLLEAAYLTRA